MAQCTAPVYGHRTASGAEACPACRGRSRGYRSYSYPSYSYPSYSPAHSAGGSGSVGGGAGSRGGAAAGGGGSVGGGSGGSVRPRWSRAGSTLVYTPTEVRALTPIRDTVEKRAS